MLCCCRFNNLEAVILPIGEICIKRLCPGYVLMVQVRDLRSLLRVYEWNWGWLL